MTNRKTPQDNDGVIEGEAVEKQTAAAKSRRATPSYKKQEPRSAGPTSRQDTGQRGNGPAESASAGPTRQNNSPSGRRRLWSTIAVLAGLAILGAGYFGLQMKQGQQAKIDRQAALETQTALLSDRVAAAELAHQALLRQQRDLDKVLAGRAAAALADISERIEAIATRLAMVEAADSARASQSEGATNLATALPALSSEMLLAQTGLVTLNAIMGDNSQGLDLGGWLPSLRALADAGLRVGDLNALEKAIAVKPPSTEQLLDDGMRLPGFATKASGGAITKQPDVGADDGFWSSLFNRLSGFITLQRSDNLSLGKPPADQALHAALSAGQLARAATLVAGMAPDPQRDEWRDAAEARLLVDSSIAAMVVALTRDLAQLIRPIEGQ